MNSGDSQATVQEPSVLRCPPLSIVDLDGADAEAILNNLTTNRVQEMSVGDVVETFLTNVKGKCIGHVMAYRTAIGFRLIGAGGQSQAITDLLDRYTIREDAVPTIRDQQTEAWVVVSQMKPPADGEQGDRQPAWWQASDEPKPFRFYRVPWLDGSPSGESTTDEGSRETCQTWLCLAEGQEAAPGAAPDQVGAVIGRYFDGLPEPSGWADSHAFHTARVAAGFPWYGVDFNDAHLPQEVNRNESTLCFTKGCYLGQETVARLDALGQVQKQIVAWYLQDLPGDERPPVDTKLFPVSDDHTGPITDSRISLEGKPVGRLTSVVAAEKPSTAVALGFARRSHFDPGAVAVGELASGVRFRATVRALVRTTFSEKGVGLSRDGGENASSRPQE